MLNGSSIFMYYEAARPLLNYLINAVALKGCEIALTSYSKKSLIASSIRRPMPLISLIIVIYV
jgi:hypothetical protein